MGEIDYGEIQQVLDDLLGQNVDFQNMAEQGASGNSPISFQNLLKMAEGLFFRELMEQKELWVHILILAIAAAVLLHFADVFQNKGVSRISFCMIYMMLFLLLITSFQGSMEITTNVLDAMKDFMTVLAPAFFLAMTLTSYISSAGIYYEFTLFLISGVRWLTSVFLLPCIEIYILLVLGQSSVGRKAAGTSGGTAVYAGGMESESAAGVGVWFSYGPGAHFAGSGCFSYHVGEQRDRGNSRCGGCRKLCHGAGARLCHAHKKWDRCGGSGGTDSALHGATYQAGGDYAGILCAGGNSAACVG